MTPFLPCCTARTSTPHQTTSATQYTLQYKVYSPSCQGNNKPLVATARSGESLEAATGQPMCAIASISTRKSFTAKADTPIQVLAGGSSPGKKAFRAALIGPASSGR